MFMELFLFIPAHVESPRKITLNLGLQEYHRIPLTHKIGLIKFSVTPGYSKCLRGYLVSRVNIGYLSL